jgi:caa(3)-type oxidase subunit IV
MTDTQTAPAAAGHGEHSPSLVNAYFIVFAALCVFTVVSFYVNWIYYEEESKFMPAAIILIVAVVKAVLVGLIFMHLKYDWAKLYFLIIPVFILGAMMMLVLMPDIVFAWHHE